MNEKAKVCELCEEQPATVLCAECCKCYCDGCGEFVHGKASKKDHKTEFIPKGVRVDAMCSLHKDEPLKLLCVDDTELCCVVCKTGRLCNGHKVVELSEVGKDNEVFSAAKVRERFKGVLKCDDDNLEKRITETIENVQKENDSAKEKVSQSFREAHEKMNNEEAAVMEELEKACSGAEDVLQRTLNDLRRVREYSAVLSEANSKTEGKRSRLMELNIVCEMEKQKKAINEIHRRMLKDLRIEWDSEKRKLSFTRHLINGAPVPKDVVFPIVYSSSADVSWSCDGEEELCRKDRKKLMYCVKIKKVSENEEGWKQAYRGQDKKCSVDELEMNTEYNVRVKCVVGELRGMWSDAATFRTKKVDSKILSEEANGDVFEEKLYEWCRTKKFELLYRGSRDGFGASNFHDKCDNEGKTLTLVKNTSGHVFGGFASIPWTNSAGEHKHAAGSFLFTLTNMHGIEPTKFPLINENDMYAIYCHSSYGPCFGYKCTLAISSDCNTNTISHANGFGTTENTTYEDTTTQKKGEKHFHKWFKCHQLLSEGL